VSPSQFVSWLIGHPYVTTVRILFLFFFVGLTPHIRIHTDKVMCLSAWSETERYGTREPEAGAVSEREGLRKERWKEAWGKAGGSEIKVVRLIDRTVYMYSAPLEEARDSLIGLWPPGWRKKSEEHTHTHTHAWVHIFSVGITHTE